MFINREISRLEKMIDPTVDVQDILNHEEQQAIDESRQKLENIKDKLIVPHHNRPAKTITLVKLITARFNCADFIDQILSSVRPFFEIRIAFAFLMSNAGQKSYVMSIPNRPINDDYRVIRTNDDQAKLMTFIRTLNNDGLLNYAFQIRNTTNPFEKSGYKPDKLISMTVWITKYTV